jgi:hypothetical protein
VAVLGVILASLGFLAGAFLVASTRPRAAAAQLMASSRETWELEILDPEIGPETEERIVAALAHELGRPITVIRR